MARRGRRGFTLVELLVVIAIIAVLIGFLLPAVQKVRQDSARLACSNNLKQLSLAAANYHSAYGQLPPGVMGPPADGPKSLLLWPEYGALCVLLPYVEQDNLYKTLSPTPDLSMAQLPEKNWWGTNSSYFAAAQNRIKTYLCPSDNDQQPTQHGVFVVLHCDATDLTMNGASLPGDSGGNSLGRTNYAPCGGAIGAGSNSFWGAFVGVFTNRSANKIGVIRDGMSNTIFFGETLGGTYPNRDFALAWMGSGSLATAWGLLDPPQWYSYGSKHTAVVQFAFGDGSVRSFRKGVGTKFFTTDWYNYQRAAGMSEGGEIDWNQLGG